MNFYFRLIKNNEGDAAGFTLLEILIAVAIMSILFLALYGSFFSVLRSQARIDGEMERTREIRRFLSVFFIEAQSSFFKENNPKTRFAADKIVAGKRPVSNIEFTAWTYPPVKEGRPAGDLMAIRYSIEEAEKGSLTLVKSTWNPYIEEKEKAFKAEVVEDVEGFDLSFFNGKDWAKAWDSSLEKRLPEAVRVSLSIKDRGEAREYSTLVRLRIR